MIALLHKVRGEVQCNTSMIFYVHIKDNVIDVSNIVAAVHSVLDQGGRARALAVYCKGESIMGDVHVRVFTMMEQCLAMDKNLGPCALHSHAPAAYSLALSCQQQ